MASPFIGNQAGGCLKEQDKPPLGGDPSGSCLASGLSPLCAGKCIIAMLRGFRISLDPAVKRLMEGEEVGSQRLVSVDIYETTQSPLRE